MRVGRNGLRAKLSVDTQTTIELGLGFVTAPAVSRLQNGKMYLLAVIYALQPVNSNRLLPNKTTTGC